MLFYSNKEIERERRMVGMTKSISRRKSHSLLTEEGRKYVGRKIWSNRYMYLMILPVVAYFIIIRYVPMGYLWA